MGLIEDAKRMLTEEPWSWYEDRAYCVYCNVHRCQNSNTNQCGIRPEPVEEHKTDCPWLAMPRIVQALEALEALRDSTVRLSRWWDTDPCFCRLCPETEDDHEERCLAVRDALTRLSGSLGMA